MACRLERADERDHARHGRAVAVLAVGQRAVVDERVVNVEAKTQLAERYARGVRLDVSGCAEADGHAQVEWRDARALGEQAVVRCRHVELAAHERALALEHHCLGDAQELGDGHEAVDADGVVGRDLALLGDVADGAALGADVAVGRNLLRVRRAREPDEVLARRQRDAREVVDGIVVVEDNRARGGGCVVRCARREQAKVRRLDRPARRARQRGAAQRLAPREVRQRALDVHAAERARDDDEHLGRGDRVEHVRGEGRAVHERERLREERRAGEPRARAAA